MTALTEFHGVQDSVTWRLTGSGVEISGSGVERTRGRPLTVTRVWEGYARQINLTAKAYGIPAELIVACVCTESGGDPDAVREEPGYTSDEATPHRVSAGLTRTLISTARETLRLSLDRAWLLVPGNSIMAGTAYMARQARETSLDPPLVAAAYNAGRLRYQGGAGNRWKLRQYPIGTGTHVDRFVRFFNDAVAVLGSHSTRPSVSVDVLLAGSPQVKRNSAAQEPVIRWADRANRAVVPDYAITVLTDLLRAASLSDALVTSTQRTPADQARAMYDNCERHGAEAQKNLYGKYGDQIIDVYTTAKAAGRDPGQIKADMTRKIVDVGPKNVSLHTADPRTLAVIDVAPSSIRDRAAFERAVKADARVARFLRPPDDPAYHLEIPKP
ncbi:transglycosylase SLT domain-containing protein [Herbidospora mongoliensis]|uniref:transglycosylase SLT domain-containing protein n=1 Tax=Herbidospora mongoliensis TaxID=688067 RepID=UPI00083656C6|nr:transglycosylase SLT domain-containing protein [Herbidospora mongoliensis]